MKEETDCLSFMSLLFPPSVYLLWNLYVKQVTKQEKTVLFCKIWRVNYIELWPTVTKVLFSFLTVYVMYSFLKR